jgi:AcrR family transcriptional regulator
VARRSSPRAPSSPAEDPLDRSDATRAHPHPNYRCAFSCEEPLNLRRTEHDGTAWCDQLPLPVGRQVAIHPTTPPPRKQLPNGSLGVSLSRQLHAAKTVVCCCGHSTQRKSREIGGRRLACGRGRGARPFADRSRCLLRRKGAGAYSYGRHRRRAGVHRSTVYYHFPNKDALLSASFVRVLNATLQAVEQCWQTDEPFLAQLVAACLRGVDIAPSSPILRSLVEDHQALGAAYHAAEGSELWRAKLADALVRSLEAAAAAGEIRHYLRADTLARWIVRISFSLIAEPAAPEDGGDQGVLGNLLVVSLKPRR